MPVSGRNGRHFSRPTTRTVVHEIERLRRQRWTGKQIAAEAGVSPATVSRVLRRLGLNKLSALEPAEPVRRYENAAATAAAPHAQTPVGATAEETDSPTSDMAASQQGTTPSQPNAQARASESNAEPQIIAPLDDAVSSIPKDSITQQSASSDFRSNDAEAVPDVSLAERQAPPEVATPDARPIPPGSALTDELVDNARMWVKPRYLIGAFVLALIGMSYYVIFRIFSWGSLYMSHGHPDDDGIEELDNKLEFYRKLHQGAALENPETI
jgi:Homeodomain-like domain